MLGKTPSSPELKTASSPLKREVRKKETRRKDQRLKDPADNSTMTMPNTNLESQDDGSSQATRKLVEEIFFSLQTFI